MEPDVSDQYAKARAQVFPAGTMCWYCGVNPAAPGCSDAKSICRRTDGDKAVWVKSYEVLVLPIPRCKNCDAAQARGAKWLLGTWIVCFVLIGGALWHYINWAAGGLLGAFLSLIVAFMVSSLMMRKRGVRSQTDDNACRDYPPIAARLAEGGWAMTNSEADFFPKPKQP